ncbi:ATP-binding protein [Streptomyces sp. NPDC050448]|uniref:ATP-binding protein n=1 Tax=Streptomyces sp. NPDC050448 TaxID=3155404 RepID=UPI00343136F7
MDNALRHARTEVVVRAATEPAESSASAASTGSTGWAVLEVEDDGPGIPEADRDRVFERFVRLDADRGRAGVGTAWTWAISTGRSGSRPSWRAPRRS